MRSLSNVYKRESVRTGLPYRLPYTPSGGAQADPAVSRRVVFLFHENEVERRVRRRYLEAKAGALATGEQAGHEQGRKESTAERERFRADAAKKRREAQEKNERTLREIDDAVRREAEEFAFTLAEQLLGYPIDRSVPIFASLWDEPEPAADAPKAAEMPPVGGEEPVGAQMEVPAVDEEVVRQAQDLLKNIPSEKEGEVPSFEKLASLPARPLQQLLKNLPVKQLAAALKGLRAEGRDAFFHAMPKHLRETVEREIEFLGPLPPEEIEHAQEMARRRYVRLQGSGELDV